MLGDRADQRLLRLGSFETFQERASSAVTNLFPPHRGRIGDVLQSQHQDLGVRRLGLRFRCGVILGSWKGRGLCFRRHRGKDGDAAHSQRLPSARGKMRTARALVSSFMVRRAATSCNEGWPRRQSSPSFPRSSMAKVVHEERHRLSSDGAENRSHRTTRPSSVVFRRHRLSRDEGEIEAANGTHLSLVV